MNPVMLIRVAKWFGTILAAWLAKEFIEATLKPVISPILNWIRRHMQALVDWINPFNRTADAVVGVV